MKIRLKNVGLIFALSAISQTVYAYMCTLNVTDVSVTYSPAATAAISVTGSYSFTCDRTSAEPATLSWDLKANSGSHASGTTNRVQRGVAADRYVYELYRGPAVSTTNRWQLANALRFTGTLNFGSALTASHPATTFYVSFPAPQLPFFAAGIYTDTVTATLGIIGSATDLTTRNFNITATTQNSCLISSPPRSLRFDYTAFQTTASTATTVFQAYCNTGLSYSIALSAPSSVLLGLRYNLLMATSAGGVLVPSSLSGSGLTGSGIPQAYRINGTIPANQAGACASGSCNASEVQTLTISY